MEQLIYISRLSNVSFVAVHYNAHMKNFALFIVMLIILPVFAENYSVHRPNTYNAMPQEGERTLFILDFSNSMSEFLDGTSKVDMMLDTMRELLPKLNPHSFVGLRVYGHKMGFTPYDACKASSLLVPVATSNAAEIEGALSQTHPRGMTPITYSLKQAVKYDFMGYPGKKHIILLTDGGENCDESPCKYVMELIKVRKDIKIDVIAFNINDEDDLAQLQCTSLVTGGKFYTANTAAELAKSLNNSTNVTKEVEAKIIPQGY